MSKKVEKTEELENVNGGYGLDGAITCSNCGEIYSRMNRPSKKVGSGCDEQTAYQCPKCGEYNTHH